MRFPELQRTVPASLGGHRLALPADAGQSGFRYPFGRKVLIAEDNWLIASEWEAALSDAGYSVLGIAVSAAEVIAISQRDRPDFVLMDVRLLGDTDGVAAAIELRARLDTPSLFITAHDDADTRRRAEAARPLGWISKPVIASRIPGLVVKLAERHN